MPPNETSTWQDCKLARLRDPKIGLPSGMKNTSKSLALAYANALIVVSALLIIVLEIFSTYLLKHHSVTYARISRQYEQAVKIRPPPPRAPPCRLMMGNSLLLHGVELDRLQALTSAS